MGPGGWTVVVMPGSGEYFGTRKPVKVGGTIDGHPFEATLLPMGDGTHLVPLRGGGSAPPSRKGDGDDVDGPSRPPART